MRSGITNTMEVVADVRIAMIGHKRFGSREGGVEVVVTELARRMVKLGHEVICYDRSGTDVMTGEAVSVSERVIEGVRVVPVRTIDKKGLAALSSSYFATLSAIKDRPDVIHYHAEGPCVPLALASRAGIRTAATIHGLDWQRAKWGRLASTYIKMGEKVAASKADSLIVLSSSAKEYFRTAYGRDATLVYNGVDVHEPLAAMEINKRWGLVKGSYFLYLGRLVPEKRADLLIDAFERLETDKRLVIAGGGSDTNEFEVLLKARAASDPRILFTGFVTGSLLAELYSNAYAYVLPSDVEGMPLSLLEAMSYGACSVTSDIPECSDVLGSSGVTFTRNAVGDLARVLDSLLDDPVETARLGEAAREHVGLAYNWDAVVEQTLALYKGEVR